MRLKQVGYLGSVSILVLLLAFAGWRMIWGARHLSPGVTVDAIRAIQIGMTEEEVYSILGQPFHRGPASFDPAVLTLTYSKPVFLARWYPMLWVHLRDGRVIEVYAKRYIGWGTDDVVVYWLGEDGYWEAELFKQTFPYQTENATRSRIF